jgi:hypothetical protein
MLLIERSSITRPIYTRRAIAKGIVIDVRRPDRAREAASAAEETQRN